MTTSGSGGAIRRRAAGARWRGSLWAGGLAIAAFLISSAQVKVGLLDYLFPLAVVLIAMRLVRDRSNGAYLEFVLWMWLLDPEVRRVVDWHSQYHSVSPILLAAPLASSICVPQLLGAWRRRPIGQPVSALLAVGGITLYGFLVGITNVGLSSSTAEVANALPPVILGLYILVAGPSIDVTRAVLRRYLLAALTVLGTYSLVQFFVLPEWDRFWMINAPINSDGLPHPLMVRVFSFLNSPEPFGTFIVCALIPVAALRSRWRWVALVVGYVGLGLSLVRSAWIGWLVSVLALLWRRSPTGRRLGRRLLLLPILILIVAGGSVEHTIVTRLTATASSGTQDTSLTARLSEYQSYLPQILRNPVGEGLGSTGTATKLSNGGTLSATGNFDGGFLFIGYDYGLVGGVLLLVAIGKAISGCRRICPPDDEFAQGCLAVLYGLAAEMLFGDVTTAVSGVAFWVVAAYIGLSAMTTDAEWFETVGPGAAT